MQAPDAASKAERAANEVEQAMIQLCKALGGYRGLAATIDEAENDPNQGFGGVQCTSHECSSLWFWRQHGSVRHTLRALFWRFPGDAEQSTRLVSPRRAPTVNDSLCRRTPDYLPHVPFKSQATLQTPCAASLTLLKRITWTPHLSEAARSSGGSCFAAKRTTRFLCLLKHLVLVLVLLHSQSNI